MSSETTPSLSHSERRAILALSFVDHVGGATHRQLLETFRSAAHAIDATVAPHAAREAYEAADACFDRAEKAGLQLLTIADDGYPESLRDLNDPPPVLWWRGSLEAMRLPMVAIVGTRRATSYGLRATREIAAGLARHGGCIVSGMALGIDAAAHRAALESGGATIAVLGTGADITYPKAHAALHREIADKGLVLSELPPGERSDPGSFLRRNRIIAALAKLTIIIEAPESSGALNTAEHALTLGRDLGAVPGAIDSPQSVGSNNLLRQGAHVVTSLEDALSLIGIALPARYQPELRGDDEGRVWRALEAGPASMDELCARASMPVAQCLTTVTALELRGIVECALTGEVRRRGG